MDSGHQHVAYETGSCAIRKEQYVELLVGCSEVANVGTSLGQGTFETDANDDGAIAKPNALTMSPEIVWMKQICRGNSLIPNQK